MAATYSTNNNTLSRVKINNGTEHKFQDKVTPILTASDIITGTEEIAKFATAKAVADAIADATADGATHNHDDLYLKLTGGTLTGDTTLSGSDKVLTLSGAAGQNSAALRFQRGTLTDNYNDWQIQDRGGYLYFGQRGSGSTAFADMVSFNTNGGVSATTFAGKLDGGLTPTAVDIASGDRLVITDSSNSSKVTPTSLTFTASTTSADYALTRNGQWTQIATRTYADDLIAANNAMVYKGVIAAITTSPGAYTPAADCGHTYRASAAGYINGIQVEIGDILICTTDSTAQATSSNYSTINNNWTVIQNNIDGAVVNTGTSVDGNIPVFDGTTGKIIEDSGVTINDLQDKIKLDGTEVLSHLSTTTIDGVQGVTAWFDDGTDEGHGVWFADGAGLSTVLDQVNEYIGTKADSDHVHGNIANDGSITTTATMVTTDSILFVDTDNDNLITVTSAEAGTSTLLNALTTGTASANMDDYLIAQYAGGGTTTKTYHRKALKNIITKANILSGLTDSSTTNKALYTTASGTATFGVLPVQAGGTGLSAPTYTNGVYIGNTTTTATTMVVVQAKDGALYSTTDNGTPKFGTLPVAQGGTGVKTFTINSLVLTGATTTAALTTRAITNNTSNTAVTSNNTNIPTMNTIYYGLATINGASQTRATNVIAATTTAPGANAILYASGTGTGSALSWLASAKGALYSTGSNSALTFSTLPVSYGGTGMTTGTYTNAVILTNTTTVTSPFQVVQSKSGAFYSTGTNTLPQFGTLPVGQGGTGNTDGTATYAETTANTGSDLYPVGVRSDTLTLLRRDTNLVMNGSTIRPASALTGTVGSGTYPFGNMYSNIFRIYSNGDSTLGQYGYLYAATKGTAATTEGTNGTQGIATLSLGNTTAVSSTVGSGTNNARGRIDLYGTGTTAIRIQAPNPSATRTLTIGNATGGGYIVATSTTASVGSSSRPVYINNTGVATALTSVSVSYGGTGVTTITSGEVMIGAGTSAITTKGIYSLSSAGNIDWGTTANRTKIPDVSVLAFWNGAYDTSGSSNLSKCSTGNIIGSNGGTISGTLILSKTTDASGTANNSPALIVGGTATTSHIEIDGNEILAKTNGTTPGTLYLQDGSGTVEVAGTGGLIVSKGHAVVGEGKDLVLKASSSASTDPGDILFQNSSGTEIGRIYKEAGADRFCVRYAANGSPYIMYTTQNITHGTGNPSGGSNGDIYIKHA